MYLEPKEFRAATLNLIEARDPDARVRIERVLKMFDDPREGWVPFEITEYSGQDGMLLLLAAREIHNRENGVFCYDWHLNEIE